MRRRATSPEEVAQIARVHALLGDINVAPSPYLMVSLASGKTHEGQLLELRAGNTRKKDGSWFSFGAITLTTGDDKIEIDYLDIVSAQKGSAVALSTRTQISARLVAGQKQNRSLPVRG